MRDDKPAWGLLILIFGSIVLWGFLLFGVFPIIARKVSIWLM